VATGIPFGAPLHHADTVRGVAFSPDPGSTDILTGSDDGFTRLWKLPAPLEESIPIDHVMLWIQVLTGMELNENGGARPLNAGEWIGRRQNLDDLRGKHSR
jgi:WD40 repeat protein